jgi:hypothetical protein
LATRNLHLLGFMTRMYALNFLGQRARLSSMSPGALRQFWQQAKDRIGEPFPNVGRPIVQPIDGADPSYFADVLMNPRFRSWRQGNLFDGMPFSFQNVEIDPLIAFQANVDLERAASLSGSLSSPPALAEKLKLCLPTQSEPMVIETPPSRQKQGTVVLSSPSLNLSIVQAGYLGAASADELHFGGVGLAPRPGVVQVVQFQNRCFLRNGYHRAYGLRMEGATDMPCLYLLASRWDQVGAEAAESPFTKDLLESDGAPTMGHFTQDRATEVLIRTAIRVVTLTYKEAVEFEP